MRLGKKSGTRMLVEICAPVAQMDQSGRFLNQRKQFFRIFVLIGSRVFSLILLTDFHFLRQLSKSDLLLFLVLI